MQALGAWAESAAPTRRSRGDIYRDLSATFHHAGETHVYAFTDVLPFRLAPGSRLPSDLPALFARLGDVAKLAAAHGRTITAHRTRDIELILADEGELSTVGRRGELVEVTRDKLAANLGPYLEARTFRRYEDVAVPVIAVSDDGSLGWLGCQIEAAGERHSSDAGPRNIAYGFTWVELYSRQDRGGRWLRIGNFSSPREE